MTTPKPRKGRGIKTWKAREVLLDGVRCPCPDCRPRCRCKVIPGIPLCYLCRTGAHTGVAV